MRVLHIVPLLAAVGLPLAAAHAGDAAPAAPTFALRFDGAKGWDAQVRCTSSRERAEGTFAATSTYRLVLEPFADGYALGVRDFAVQSAGTPPGGFDMEGTIGRLAGLAPRTLLATDGTFRGIEDAAANTDRILDAVLAGIPAEAKGMAEPTLRQVVTPEMLTSSAADEWGTLVDFWLGAELEAGREYTMDQTLPFPLVPGATIPAAQRFSAKGPVACGASGGDGCVELRTTTVPDAAAMEKAIGDFLEDLGRKMGQAPPKGAIRRVAMENGTVLVTEPGTLRPHALTRKKTVEVEGMGPGGKVQTQRRVDESACTYTWPS